MLSIRYGKIQGETWLMTRPMTILKANEQIGNIITEEGVIDNNSSLRIIIKKRITTL